MAVLNLTVVGNVGGDAILSDVNGRKVLKFSVAHTESYKNNEGVKVDKTVWISVNYWSDETKLASFIKKGDVIYVSGTPEARCYQDKDGKWVAQQVLTAREIKLLPNGRQENPAN